MKAALAFAALVILAFSDGVRSACPELDCSKEGPGCFASKNPDDECWECSCDGKQAEPAAAPARPHKPARVDAEPRTKECPDCPEGCITSMYQGKCTGCLAPEDSDLKCQ